VNTVTVKGVELLKVGTWQTVSHPDGWTVTQADLRSAMQAAREGVIRAAPLRLGHSSKIGDGAPALGKATGFRLTDGGQTLVCDFQDVPKSVAPWLLKAYNQRSVEALVGYRDAAGRTWPLIIEAVALLGAELPGVDSLNDVAALYDGVAAAARRVSIAASAFHPDPAAARHRAIAIAAAARRRRTNPEPVAARNNSINQAVMLAARRRRNQNRTIGA
jgi:hypothetical protein